MMRADRKCRPKYVLPRLIHASKGLQPTQKRWGQQLCNDCLAGRDLPRFHWSQYLLPAASTACLLDCLSLALGRCRLIKLALHLVIGRHALRPRIFT